MIDRLQSLDVLRAGTVLVIMALGPAAVPEAVYGLLLFVMGAAVVPAFDRRWAAGQTAGEIALHVAGRTIALSLIGLFVSNGVRLDAAASRVPYVVWNGAVILALLALWLELPGQGLRWRGRIVWLRVMAVLVLLAAAVFYRSTYGTRLALGDRGIRGGIAGAYGVAAGLHGWCRGTRLGTWPAFVAVVAWNAGYHLGFSALPVLGNGAAASIALAGVVAGEQLAAHRRAVLVVLPVLMLAAAFVLRMRFPIPGILSTPNGCLVASAAATAALLLLFMATDGRGGSRWAEPLARVGRHALTLGLVSALVHALLRG